MSDASARERALAEWLLAHSHQYGNDGAIKNRLREASAAVAALADERERTRRLEKTLTLARSQFAWIAREATGDNDQGRIIHAAQRGQDAIDALDGAEES